uniref:LRAT domain-containing protein n=1 Tax=Serinus canaria TaxID=9135 RepID=A0A8C9KY69_SERCA
MSFPGAVRNPSDILEEPECLLDCLVSSLASPDEEASSIFLSSSSISATRAKVKMELLKDVVKNDNWRVNNKYDRSRTPRRVKEIIRDAEQWIGEEVSYDVLTNNCEHFVTELRYGEALCDQVKAINGGVIAAALGIV